MNHPADVGLWDCFLNFECARDLFAVNGLHKGSGFVSNATFTVLTKMEIQLIPESTDFFILLKHTTVSKLTSFNEIQF